MMLPRRISSRRAAEILRRVFGHRADGLVFRLWDGTSVTLGAGAPVCAVLVKSPASFIRLVRDPSPLNFAEAYVEEAIDLDGDLFAAMSIANSVEELRVSLADRMQIFLALWRR